MLIKTKTRRAVSDIIVTLLLLAITIIGGILAWSFFSNNPTITNIDIGITTSNISPPLKLSGHDTRDGNDLMEIEDLDNSKNNELEAGTDFIAIDITNTGIDNFFVVESILINNVVHVWNQESSGSFSTSSLSAGQFTVVTTDSDDPTYLSNVINEGTTARVIIKLSSDLDDIKVNRAIRVDFVITNFDIANFIIRSGETI